MKSITQLLKLAEPHGLTVKDCGNGHLQITGGPLLVNYYPESKRRSAYIAGTTQRYEHVSIQKAIEMAMEAPPVAHGERKDNRKGSYRSAKIKMLGRFPFCHWCHHKLSIDGVDPNTRKATMEHVIPLHRGGLDNANNRVLACEGCNHGRGHEMPEVKKAGTK